MKTLSHADEPMIFNFHDEGKNYEEVKKNAILVF